MEEAASSPSQAEEAFQPSPSRLSPSTAEMEHTSSTPTPPYSLENIHQTALGIFSGSSQLGLDNVVDDEPSALTFSREEQDELQNSRHDYLSTPADTTPVITSQFSQDVSLGDSQDISLGDSPTADRESNGDVDSIRAECDVDGVELLSLGINPHGTELHQQQSTTRRSTLAFNEHDEIEDVRLQSWHPAVLGSDLWDSDDEDSDDESYDPKGNNRDIKRLFKEGSIASSLLSEPWAKRAQLKTVPIGEDFQAVVPDMLPKGTSQLLLLYFYC